MNRIRRVVYTRSSTRLLAAEEERGRTRRKRSGKGRRSTVETERERRCCGWTYTRERDIMALLQSAYIIRARAPLLPFASPARGLLLSFSLTLSPAMPSSHPRSLFPPRTRWCRRTQDYTLSSRRFSRKLTRDAWRSQGLIEYTPPPRESTPRVYPRGRRRNCSEPSGFRCRLPTMERNVAFPSEKLCIKSECVPKHENDGDAVT